MTTKDYLYNTKNIKFINFENNKEIFKETIIIELFHVTGTHRP